MVARNLLQLEIFDCSYAGIVHQCCALAKDGILIVFPEAAGLHNPLHTVCARCGTWPRVRARRRWTRLTTAPSRTCCSGRCACVSRLAPYLCTYLLPSASPASDECASPLLQNHLLSGSLDSTVKVWAVAETPAPGAVLEAEPKYTHVALDSQVGTFSFSFFPCLSFLPCCPTRHRARAPRRLNPHCSMLAVPLIACGSWRHKPVIDCLAPGSLAARARRHRAEF